MGDCPWMGCDHVSVSSSDRASGATQSRQGALTPWSVVSVSSSDRASGATSVGAWLAEDGHDVSVSSSDRASGATAESDGKLQGEREFQYPRRIEPLVQRCSLAVLCHEHLMFQYPRRIEPLVQHLEEMVGLQKGQSFSILVGSSLWCNGSRSKNERREGEGFSILVGSSLWCNYPQEELSSEEPIGFSILVGSSLWCNLLFN